MRVLASLNASHCSRKVRDGITHLTACATIPGHHGDGRNFNQSAAQRHDQSDRVV